MGSGTHWCPKVSGFPVIHGNQANWASHWLCTFSGTRDMFTIYKKMPLFCETVASNFSAICENTFIWMCMKLWKSIEFLTSKTTWNSTSISKLWWVMLYCSLSLWFVGTQNLFLCHVTQPVDILEFTALTVVKKMSMTPKAKIYKSMNIYKGNWKSRFELFFVCLKKNWLVGIELL